MNYIGNCVAWPNHDVSALQDMIDRAIDVSRRTFLKHVDRAELRGIEESLGYERHPCKGLTMAGDYHVSYHRSKLHGQTVYYFRQSSVEYVFSA